MHPAELVVRPRRMRRAAVSVAVLVVLVSGAVAVFLKQSSAGVEFDTADQFGVFGVGLVVAGGVLLAVRPQVRADGHGVRVRNLLSEREVPWDLVREVRFPERSLWAHLDLLDDEVVTLLAVQSFDGESTVDALDRLRRLHQRHASPSD